MPIAALGLSGHCNGYWATVAVVCNNRSSHIAGQSLHNRNRYMVNRIYGTKSGNSGISDKGYCMMAAR